MCTILGTDTTPIWYPIGVDMSHFITSSFSNRISNFSTLTNSQITFALPLTLIDFTSNSPLSKKSRTIKNNNNNITSFKENNDKKFEEDCYPKINVIHYQGKHTYYYQYNILNLGNYLTNARYTQRSRHRIPNGYRIQVMYKVTWEEKDGKKCCVNSLRSTSDAAKQFVQKINAKGSTLSGVILFGLDLKCIKLRCKNKENILPINLKKKKPFSNLKSKSQKNKRLKKLALDINSNTKDLFDSHRFSNINLDSLKLNIQRQFIRIKFSNFNNELESQIQLDSIIHVYNNNLISREGYRQLSAKINAKGSTLSGVILFGLDLKCIKLRCKNKENILPINLKKKKPFSNLKSRSQKNKRLKKLALDINSNTKDLFDSHRFSNINLDSLKLNIQRQFIRIKFSNFNNELESQIQLDSIIHVYNNNLISREGYRQLSAVQPSLERE
ncbi:hypothetical protein Glove_74g103 [Diversispora epigaea]|uniref:Uncharacterized protein n=1 Tax=Diversispora epigaea TaxID=1348612 RepID=A0A397JJV5_9GLOM|nr:hypothetical protein Glove_74g103 [Diversispora epigaea]